MMTIFTILGALFSFLGLAFYFAERRRSPDSVPGSPIKISARIPTILLWRWSEFYRALGYFDQYCDEVTKRLGGESTDPSPSIEDLLRFAESSLLAASAGSLPFSQGKANIFAYDNAPEAERREIVSRQFLGAFPPRQLIAVNAKYRAMVVDEAVERRTLAAASQAILHRGPVLVPVKHTGYASEIEQELHTTHILGVPTGDDQFHVIEEGHPAAITVDLKIPLLMRRSLGGRIISKWACRRGRFISSRLKRLLDLERRCNGDAK